MNAVIANQDGLLTIKTANVSQLQHANTGNNTLVMPIIATNAENAYNHKFQLKTDEDATDLNQFVVVLNSIHKMDTHACHAHHLLLLHKITHNAFQLSVEMEIQWLETRTPVTDADHANKVGDQIHSREYA